MNSGTEDEEIRVPAATIGVLRSLDVQGRVDEMVGCVGAGDSLNLKRSSGANSKFSYFISSSATAMSSGLDIGAREYDPERPSLDGRGIEQERLAQPSR
jgi:hypothetical protein